MQSEFKRRLLRRGVQTPAVLFAYGETLLFLQQSDRLFALLHALPQDAQCLQSAYAYLNGVYAFLRKDYYQALEHLNVCLLLQTQSVYAWTAIGFVRSALVGKPKLPED